MPFFQRVKKTVKPFVDVPRWIDFATLKDFGKNVIGATKKLLVPSQPTYTESFEQAMVRLNLTEEDVAQRIKQFRLYVMIFFGGAIGLLIYDIYLLWQGTYMAFFAVLGLMLLMLGQAFRYDFWLYQMRQRKLGCSFGEWLAHCFKRT